MNSIEAAKFRCDQIRSPGGISGEIHDGINAAMAQRDAWRAACRYLYEVIGERTAKGRPLDLIASGDWGRIVAMIGKAESLEERQVEANQ